MVVGDGGREDGGDDQDCFTIKNSPEFLSLSLTCFLQFSSSLSMFKLKF